MLRGKSFVNDSLCKYGMGYGVEGGVGLESLEGRPAIRDSCVADGRPRGPAGGRQRVVRGNWSLGMGPVSVFLTARSHGLPRLRQNQKGEPAR
jgi:hypothetical protein